jgi:hypothetical protein
MPFSCYFIAINMLRSRKVRGAQCPCYNAKIIIQATCNVTTNLPKQLSTPFPEYPGLQSQL